MKSYRPHMILCSCCSIYRPHLILCSCCSIYRPHRYPSYFTHMFFHTRSRIFHVVSHLQCNPWAREHEDNMIIGFFFKQIQKQIFLYSQDRYEIFTWQSDCAIFPCWKYFFYLYFLLFDRIKRRRFRNITPFDKQKKIVFVFEFIENVGMGILPFHSIGIGG